MNEERLNQPSRKPNAALISIIVIAVLALLGGGAYAVLNRDETSTPSTQSTTQSASQTTTETGASGETSVRTYTDGTYTDELSYTSPGGTHDVSVNVTLAGGVVTAVDTTFETTDRESREYQERFLAAYKDDVVGKSIDSIDLSRVSGASLTTNAFMRALDQIKTDAVA